MTTSKGGDESERCPSCGATHPLPILYGLPTSDAFEAAERGEMSLGGCFTFDLDFECRSCGAQWARRGIEETAP